MNKELIELQKGCNATCVVISDNNYKELGRVLVMDARLQNEYLFGYKDKNPIFKEKLEEVSKDNDISYFVIRNLDLLDKESQNKYIGLIKDREFCGYNIPKNVILVFTVKDKNSLKNISEELYNLAVICF